MSLNDLFFFLNLEREKGFFFLKKKVETVNLIMAIIKEMELEWMN